MEEIFKRTSFEEYDPTIVAHIDYAIYEEVPRCTDFEYGARKTIILRNKETNLLEQLDYIMTGCVSRDFGEEKLWYWGRVQPECGIDLAFYFDLNGRIENISAIYSAPNLVPAKNHSPV